MPEPTIPDTGEALRTFLLSLSPVTAIVSDRVSLDLTSSLPSIRYAMVSGFYLGGGAVMVTWQIECWGPAGPDDGTCHTLSRAVVSGSRTMRGTYGNAVVSGSWPTVPMPLDDPTTGRPRDIVDLTFSATP